jgi:putative Mg2+ transporter-C (MgtC) family protein
MFTQSSLRILYFRIFSNRFHFYNLFKRIFIYFVSCPFKTSSVLLNQYLQITILRKAGDGTLMDISIDFLLKIGISAGLGLIIGLEREIKRKPVGLKTSLVISIVSCLLTIISIEAAYKFPGSDQVNIQMDPLRLPAQIVSGIGFLGAGVILRRGNDSISGLTTAALIWGAGGIGIAVGAGYYIEALIGVTLLLISVKFVPIFMSTIGPRQLREKEIKVKLKAHQKENVTTIIKSIQSLKTGIKHLRIKDLETGEHSIHLILIVNQKREVTEVYREISEINGVKEIEIESLN